jgi:ABC-type branched-subunit amino acid transport system permease subunit
LAKRHSQDSEHGSRQSSSSKRGVPLELSVVLAMLITVPMGLIVAIPALRTLGVTLAIATLALGALIQSLILNNAEPTGGFTGFNVQDAEFFGLNSMMAWTGRHVIANLVPSMTEIWIGPAAFIAVTSAAGVRLCVSSRTTCFRCGWSVKSSSQSLATSYRTTRSSR